jgi:hypothetical protein
LPQAPEDDNDNDDGIAATWPLTAADRT